MSMRLEYLSSGGISVNLRSRHYLVEDVSPLYAYEWNSDIHYNRITGFNRVGVFTKSFQIAVTGRSALETAALKNELYKIFESDVEAGMPGRLYVNNHYVQCYIVSEDLNISMSRLKKSVYKIMTDYPVWIRELETVSFATGGQGVGGASNDPDSKSYPYGYNYGYPNPSTVHSVTNSAAVPVNFRLLINGAWNNPTVTIAGHIYNVNVTLQTNEQLVIDSMTREIVKISGAKGINVFALRNKDSDKRPFEKIPPGISDVIWMDDHTFFLTLIEERSAPEWQI